MKNKHLKKIIDSEKEDLQTLKKVFKGEKLESRVKLSDLNPLKLLADNWLFTIVLLCFFLGGFFLGTVAFQSVCNDALLEIQDDCNEFYRGSDTGWMDNIFNNSAINFSYDYSINIED